MLLNACSCMALVLAWGQPQLPEAKGRGPLWVPEGQF